MLDPLPAPPSILALVQKPASGDDQAGEGAEPSSNGHAPKVGRIHFINRAKAYLEKCDPAVSGQGGHAQTFKVACKLIHGFKLTADEAYQLLVEDYNPRCLPPWTLAELDHKVQDAAKNGKCDDLLAQEPTKKPAPAAAEKKKAPPAGPVVFTAQALLNKHHDEMRWAVEGIFPEGAVILAGRPKTGKSWLTMQLAVTIACGGKALNKFPVQQGDVLYLALEDGERRLKKRLKKLLGAELTHPALSRIHFACDWPRHSKGGIEALDAWLAAHKLARLVVIDTLARVRDKRSAAAGIYEEDYEAIALAKTIGDRHGVCIVVNTHTRKATADDPLDEVSGTLGLTGAADAVMVLKRPRLSAEGKLYVSGRDLEEQEIHLLFNSEACLWGVNEETPDPLGPDRAAVLHYLKQAGVPLSCIELVPLLKKTPEATAQLLGRMVKEGLLQKAGYGKYEPVASTPFDK